jgi:hypothetical protein
MMRKQKVFTMTPILKTLALLLGTGLFMIPHAQADEGGTSFWLPGQNASLTAVQAAPGWSIPLIYYHSSVEDSGNTTFSKGNKITVGLDVDMDLLLAVPTYVFTTPVWGAQASVSLTGLYGGATVDVDATLSEPDGDVISDSESESSDGFGDLYPAANLKWNFGNHNTMAYSMLGVPVGKYDADDLANIGTNHWAIDLGGGYTYYNPKSGREFSATLGFTYNFENPDTDYQNGIDSHLDLAASQFVTDQMHLGLVGYVYYQLTGDSGDGAVLGDFKSKVNGLGPQLGYMFKLWEKDAYFNIKAYWEFDADHRPDGWNGWLTLSIPI